MTLSTCAPVDIRTIDSIIGHIATAYHAGLGLPSDIAAWLRQNAKTGHQELALKVARLLKRHPMIAAAVARRHPVVICDEHQDSSGDQHATVMALYEQGARLRVFSDPVQRIFRTKTLKGSHPPCDWDALRKNADACAELDYPHRWDQGCARLGNWTLQARELLKSNGVIDLRDGLPPSVNVVYAENMAQARTDYRLTRAARRPIDRFLRDEASLLILTRYNDTAQSLRAFFNRSVPLWEGYTRQSLDRLAEAINASTGDRTALATAVVAFVNEVGKGFSPSAFGNRFKQEVQNACVKTTKGKPALVQGLARCLVDDPTHRGVAAVLERLAELKSSEPAFADFEVDCVREFRDAIRLGTFETPDAGLAEITHRRTYGRPKPPDRAISTIHKAKGLECDSVIVTPCNKQTFPDKENARCLLYVALSRARKRLMLVVSREEPSGPPRHNIRTRTWVAARNHRRITAPHTRTFNHGAALARYSRFEFQERIRGLTAPRPRSIDPCAILVGILLDHLGQLRT